MNKVRFFVESSVEPDKRMLWIKEGILHYFSKNGWQPVTGESEVSWEDVLNKPSLVTPQDLTTIKNNISTLQKDIKDLKDRVTVLEQSKPEPVIDKE